VAKKVRGASSTHRPGGQGPSRNKKTSDASADEDVSEATTDVNEPIDAEYSEITLEEPAAVATTAAPAESKRRRTRRRTRAKSDDLASRAAAEDVWVREDLRRIGIVSVVLVAALAVSWVVFYLLDVLSLY
jgi:hypothetical protein